MSDAPPTRSIFLSGASSHNLRGIDVEFQTNEISVVCGVSGSGKSSLISGCLLPESKLRRDATMLRTTELTPPYCPEVSDARVPRFISVGQGVIAANARSTVGTYSGLLDSLRVVALNGADADIRDRSGCTLAPVRSDQLADWLFNKRAATDVAVYATVARKVTGKFWGRFLAQLPADLLDSVIVVESGMPPKSGKPRSKTSLRNMEARTRRDLFVATGTDIQSREDFEKHYNIAANVAVHDDDVIVVMTDANGQCESFHVQHLLFSSAEPEPYYRLTESLMSFNSEATYSGGCEACGGAGQTTSIPLSRMLADSGAPLATGGIALPFSQTNERYKYLAALTAEIRGLLAHRDYPLDASWNDLDDETRQMLVHDGSREPIQPRYSDGRAKGKKSRFDSLNSQFERLNERKRPPTAVSELITEGPCPACEGLRFNKQARAVHLGGIGLSQIASMTMRQLNQLARERITTDVTAGLKAGWQRVELLAGNMVELGLSHLSMSRATDSLSGGEGQRLRIGRALLENNRGVGYVFDEPTLGMHHKDSNRLVGTLRAMLDDDVAIILVDHSRNVVQMSDYVVELGPGSGAEGGTVTHAGPAAAAPMLDINAPPRNRTSGIGGERCKFHDINFRTIVNQSVEFPLGTITCVAGVSGSGKSTLMESVIYPALVAGGDIESANVKLPADEFHVMKLRQGQVNRNPRSFVATFLEVADELRAWFHRESGAEQLGLDISDFSPNVTESQCSRCSGLGVETWDAGAVQCVSCDGTGLRAASLLPEVLERTFADWANMGCEQLAECPKLPELIRQYASICCDLGLGHLSLGRRVPTLSGGESQRLRIVKTLGEARAANGNHKHLILLLDEPAAGLHPSDVATLIQTLERTREQLGCTFVLVEHSLDVIKTSDWLIEMGPGSAEHGGQVIYCGGTAGFLNDNAFDSATKQAITEASSEAAHPYPPVTTSSADNASNAKNKLEPLAPLGAVTREPERFRIDGKMVAGAEKTRVCATLGVLNPLLEIFAHRTSIASEPETLIERALEVWNEAPEHRRLAWFPLTAKLEHEALTYEDFRVEIRRQLRTLADGWFDGEKALTKPPNKGEVVDMRRVRLIREVSPGAEPIEQALQLGCGWMSIIDTRTSEIFEFTTRELSLDDFRIGPRQHSSFSLDPRHMQCACRLCHGVGALAAPAMELVFRPDKSGFESIETCLTELAARILRKSGIRDIEREIRKFEEAGLIDLSEKEGFKWRDHPLWNGFPDREMLKPRGDANKVADWIRWKGLAAIVIVLARAASTSTEDRELILNSVSEKQCPRCDGTGLGWAARTAALRSTTLQTILERWTSTDLVEWLKTSDDADVETESRDALYSIAEHLKSLGLGELRLGSRLDELSTEHLAAVKALVACHFQLMFSEVALSDELSSDQEAYILSLGRSLHSAVWVGSEGHN